MPRFLLPPDAWTSPAPALTGGEARHLAQVLRVRCGDIVTVFDGIGTRAPATVTELTRDRVALHLGPPERPASPVPRLTLAQAIPKGKTMDDIVRMAVELGVAAIQPLVTRHTIVHPGDRKAEKWRRTALEACKQCGQDTLPDIADPVPFHSWLVGITTATRGKSHPQPSSNPENTTGLAIIASLAQGARPLRDIMADHPATTSASLLIGPEGDFAPDEIAAAIAAGFQPATLGPIVLRVDTAAVFCIAALRCHFG